MLANPISDRSTARSADLDQQHGWSRHQILEGDKQHSSDSTRETYKIL